MLQLSWIMTVAQKNVLHLEVSTTGTIEYDNNPPAERLNIPKNL